MAALGQVAREGRGGGWHSPKSFALTIIGVDHSAAIEAVSAACRRGTRFSTIRRHRSRHYGPHPRVSGARSRLVHPRPGKTKKRRHAAAAEEAEEVRGRERTVVALFLRARLSYMVQFETVYWPMPKLVSKEEREYP